MANPRTTSRLVETAIKGAQSAGLAFRAVEVRGGGVVRIIFDDPDASGAIGGNECDAIFEERSG